MRERGLPNDEPESNPSQYDVTGFLQKWSAGDPAALHELIPLVYRQLRDLARAHLQKERSDHTLQPTALVHEAFLRLIEQKNVTWQSRAHFFGVAARMMRRILVDHARACHAERRGGGEEKLSLDEIEIAPEANAPALLALHGALEDFAKAFPRQAEVVELKFFGGLEAREIAEFMEVSEKTILRDWHFAKLWLYRELSEEDHLHGAGAS
jgi:RNA polymerase sigma factor (TIGR02999 family)